MKGSTPPWYSGHHTEAHLWRTWAGDSAPTEPLVERRADERVPVWLSTKSQRNCPERLSDVPESHSCQTTSRLGSLLRGQHLP